MLNKDAQTAFLAAALGSAGIPEKHAPAARELLSRAWLDDGGFMTAMVNVYMKKNVAKAIGAKGTGPVNACVAALLAAGLAKQVDASTIAFDPKAFGSEDWRSADSARISREFGPNGVAVKTEIDYGDGFVELAESEAYEAIGTADPDGATDETVEETEETDEDMDE